MKKMLSTLLLGAAGVAIARWYGREVVREGEAMVHFQREHEHLHMHVDLPSDMEIEPGDTLHVLSLPPVSETHGGEVSYDSRVRLHKASWLRRTLVKSSSLVEVNELVEHP